MQMDWSSEDAKADSPGSAPQTPPSDEPTRKIHYFDHLWKVYTETLAVSMDLFELADSETWCGSGMRDFSAMLSTEQCIAESINPRQLLWSTFSVLSSSYEPLYNDPHLMLDLVHACRAVLYIRGADSLDKREVLWDKFVSGKTLSESGSHLTRWSQWVLAELGAPEVLSKLAGSTEASVKLGNILFGTALLAGGNRKLQDMLSAVINEGESDLFSSVVVELEEAQSELKYVSTQRCTPIFDSTALAGGSSSRTCR